MTPTLDEMCAMFWDCFAEPQGKWSTLAPLYKAACAERMSAVIKTHIVPMVAEAHARGRGVVPSVVDTEYSARIEREIMEVRDV